MSWKSVTHRARRATRCSAMALAVLAGAAVAIDRGLPSASAAEPVAAATYAMSIQHRNLSTVVLDNGVTGLELELTLHNGGERDLYDVRAFLDRLEGGAVIAHSPAKLQTLAAGETATLTWTFEGLLALPASSMLARIGMRVEAVDTVTQDVVTFAVESTEE